jgi:hypothetical protein
MATVKHTLLPNIFWSNSLTAINQVAFGIGSATSFIYSVKIINGVFFANRHKIKITQSVKFEKITNFRTVVPIVGFTIFIIKIIIMFTLFFLKDKYIYLDMIDRPFEWVWYYELYESDLPQIKKSVNAVLITKLVGICQITAILLVTLPAWSGFLQKYIEYLGYLIWICCTICVYKVDQLLPLLFNLLP